MGDESRGKSNPNSIRVTVIREIFVSYPFMKMKGGSIVRLYSCLAMAA
jgi:hypothetical protein